MENRNRGGRNENNWTWQHSLACGPVGKRTFRVRLSAGRDPWFSKLPPAQGLRANGGCPHKSLWGLTMETLLIGLSHTQALGPASLWTHIGSAYLGMTVGSACHWWRSPLPGPWDVYSSEDGLGDRVTRQLSESHVAGTEEGAVHRRGDWAKKRGWGKEWVEGGGVQAEDGWLVDKLADIYHPEFKRLGNLSRVTHNQSQDSNYAFLSSTPMDLTKMMS